MRVHENSKKLIVILFSSLAAITVVTTSLVIQNNRNVATTQASSACKCTDANVCYPDGCSRKPKTDDNRFDESRYDSVCRQFDPGYRIPDSLLSYYCSEHQPDCCFDIYRYKDSRLCCWQERYTCHPSLCQGSSGGDGCGKYWGLPNGWNAYGCVKKGDDDNTVPNWGLPPGLPIGTAPTNNPQPTAPPTNTPQPTATPIKPTPTSGSIPVPTATPTNIPNNPTLTKTPIPQPTSIVNTTPPSPTSTVAPNSNNNNSNQSNSNSSHTPILPGSQIPTINMQMPRIALKSPKQIIVETVDEAKIEKLNQATNLPLNGAKNTFLTVRSYDQKLEDTVEQWIFYIRIQIAKILN